MNKQELYNGLSMSYIEYVHFLKSKYGSVPFDYFISSTCNQKETRNSRTKNGLYVHHIFENKAERLSNSKDAIKHPFEYQKAKNLIYANELEHLLLHIKIFEENEDVENPFFGIKGICSYLTYDLNDFYNGSNYFATWKLNCLNIVQDNYNDYIYLLAYFLNIIYTKKQIYDFDIKNLCFNQSGELIQKIYHDLHKKINH